MQSSTVKLNKFIHDVDQERSLIKREVNSSIERLVGDVAMET